MPKTSGGAPCRVVRKGEAGTNVCDRVKLGRPGEGADTVGGGVRLGLPMLVLAFKNVWQRKGIACLALLGVGLGSALIIVLLSLSGGVDRNLDQTVSTLAGKLVVSPEDALFGGMFFGSGTPLPAGDLAVVRATAGVRDAYGRVSTVLRPAGLPDMALPFTGYSREEIQSGVDTPFNKVVVGHAPTSDREIIIGQRMEDTLSFVGHRLAVGHTYPFLLADGGSAQLLVTGIFQTRNEITDTTLAGYIGLARQLASLSAQDYSSLSVSVGTPAQVLPVERALLANLTGKNPAVQVVAPEDLLNPLEAGTKAVDRLMLAISVLCALGCALFISIIGSITVLERMKEFAVLKALGWRGRHITALVLLEALILSLAGTFLGMALGLGAAVIAGFAFKLGMPAWSQLARVAVLACVVGTVGGIFPARRAGRVAPAVIFRQV